MQGRVDLDVPFAEKDEAKALGARWDPACKTWYVPAGLDPDAFERWLPADEGQIELVPPVYAVESKTACWRCDKVTQSGHGRGRVLHRSRRIQGTRRARSLPVQRDRIPTAGASRGAAEGESRIQEALLQDGWHELLHEPLLLRRTARRLLHALGAWRCLLPRDSPSCTGDPPPPVEASGAAGDHRSSRDGSPESGSRACGKGRLLNLGPAAESPPAPGALRAPLRRRAEEPSRSCVSGARNTSASWNRTGTTLGLTRRCCRSLRPLVAASHVACASGAGRFRWSPDRQRGRRQSPATSIAGLEIADGPGS